MRSPKPARIPTIPICPRGFWSNHSRMNSRAYSSVKSKRVGRISRSIIAEDKSSSRITWRMIVRRMAAAGARSLCDESASVRKFWLLGGVVTFCDGPWPLIPLQMFANYQPRPLELCPMNAYKMLPKCTLAKTG